MASTEPWLLENGSVRCLTKDMKHGHGHSHCRTAHNMSSSSLRKKSDLTLVSKVRQDFLRNILVNLQVVLLGTKLSILFLAIPFAIAAECKNFGRSWVFALSLLGLTPLAERVSFLTEQIAFYTGPTGNQSIFIHYFLCDSVKNHSIFFNHKKDKIGPKSVPKCWQGSCPAIVRKFSYFYAQPNMY
ncbi:vacuolar cation/proton exchanger 3-like [Olea europaea var. sylvestris]|uniref:vacuolar cation/proton exchanger 3-like n=1 Tax=Olea europaea var. sylvestris TaxID=158386 RepID=UPI000C1D7BA1|nr:vacuolar cation/proton exchanger 3-like [Olea europaea var. sylvestris]